MDRKENSTGKINNIHSRICKLFILIIFLLLNREAYPNGNEKLEATLPAYSGAFDFGVVSFGSFGLNGEATSLMKIPEDAEIMAGYVYLSACANITPAELGDIEVVFTNSEGIIVVTNASVIGYSNDSADLSFTYRADVTDVLTTGENRYKVKSKSIPVRPTSGKIYGGGLIVIYSLPNLPESTIWIADGVDYFNANDSIPASATTIFQFTDNRFERFASIKMFAGIEDENSASGIWYKSGHGMLSEVSIIDAEEAQSYNHSSDSDPDIDTNPLEDGLGIRQAWSMTEFDVPVLSEQSWLATQVESQIDYPGKSPASGILTMVAFKLPNEEISQGLIGDRVFHDKDQNGVRDQQEIGIPGVKLYLYRDDGDNVLDKMKDSLIDSTTSNRLGFYMFQYLDAGNYIINIDHPYLSNPDVLFTATNNPSGVIHLDTEMQLFDVDFGFAVSGREPFSPANIDSFLARIDTNRVVLNWDAEAGTENIGFDIYRSETITGEFVQINEDIIPVQADPDDVHSYSYEDFSIDKSKTYYYKLADVALDGSTTMYGPVNVEANSLLGIDNTNQERELDSYNLGEAYPNPFNGHTKIIYSVNKPDHVKVEIFNLLGQKIKTLVSKYHQQGTHSVMWNGENEFGKKVGSGIYFYQMTSGNFRSVKRVLYLK